jgi:hypothetical protein
MTDENFVKCIELLYNQVMIIKRLLPNQFVQNIILNTFVNLFDELFLLSFTFFQELSK